MSSLESRSIDPGTEQSTGDPMLQQDRWEEIRRLHDTERHSVSAIARQLDLDRKTVRRCLRQTAWQPYRRTPRRETLLCWPHTPGVCVERAPQVHYSARILFQELRASRGYQRRLRHGEDARARRCARRPRCRRSRRRASRPSRASRRRSTGARCAPRFAAGADRSARLRDDAGLLAPRLGRGLRERAHGGAARSARARLRALRRAHRARSSTTACARSCAGTSAEGKPRWNPTFEAFARHWGFEPRLCRPYRAQTKGKVESGVKYVKRNFLPGRVFRDLDGLQRAARRLARRDRRRAHPRHHPRAADRALRARGRRCCAHARASRASCRRCAREPDRRRGLAGRRSTPTATRCRGA